MSLFKTFSHLNCHKTKLDLQESTLNLVLLEAAILLD